MYGRARRRRSMRRRPERCRISDEVRLTGPDAHRGLGPRRIRLNRGRLPDNNLQVRFALRDSAAFHLHSDVRDREIAGDPRLDGLADVFM